jgi:Chloride channel protein EriC
LASAVAIGSVGSAGREGPIVQLSASLGSMVADLLGLSPEDRRIAVAVGIGAGIGTVFKAPLGGALLAAEILYRRTWRSR